MLQLLHNVSQLLAHLADVGEPLAYLLFLLLGLFLQYFQVLGQVYVPLCNKGHQLLLQVTCVIRIGGHEK